MTAKFDILSLSVIAFPHVTDVFKGVFRFSRAFSALAVTSTQSPAKQGVERGLVSKGEISQNGNFETRIGLELHVQVTSASKLFSASSASAGLHARPNTAVSPFDLAVPGTLPTVNRACVIAAAKAGLAFGGVVQQVSTFERKHYFYPDLPHGYQITQRESPIVLGGFLDVPADGGGHRRVRIDRVQLETDTAQSVDGPSGRDTLLDFNRAGCALLEIVTLPDMRSAHEAVAFLTAANLPAEAQKTLRAIGVGECLMEEGHLRADVNVSVRSAGGAETERSELKNMIGVRFIRQAIEYEEGRHRRALLGGQTLAQETRGYDPGTGTTHLLRSKEDAPDYRFMPEPDLPPVTLTKEEIEALRDSMPELPRQTLARLEGMGASPEVAALLVERRSLLALLEDVLAKGTAGIDTAGSGSGSGAGGRGGRGVGDWGDVSSAAFSRAASDFVGREVVGALSRAGVLDLRALPETLSGDKVHNLLVCVMSGRITRRMARDILGLIVNGDGRPVARLLEEFGGAISDSEDAVLEAVCRRVVASEDMRSAVETWRAGKKRGNMMRAFLGKVMKETKGRADAQKATVIIEGLLRQAVQQ